jgi:hypothetical protein
MTEKEQEELRKKWSALFFGVRRSIRYHTYRRKFFDTLGVWTNFLTIVGGSGAVVAAVQSNKVMGMIFGSVAGAIAAFDLVLGFSIRARDHHDLCKSFSELEREMTTADNSRSHELYAKFRNRRLEIQEGEPPILRVLNNYCHNELCRASGKEAHNVTLSFWQELFKQWFDFRPSTMVTFEQREAKKLPQPPSISPAAPA